VLSYNVAALLRSAPGTERRYAVAIDELPIAEALHRAVDRGNTGYHYPAAVESASKAATDFYESFSNLVHQSIESREFPLGFAVKPGGGFLISRGGALDMGPRTSRPIMPGFRAGSRHSGSILEISADGSRIETYASGLREPFIGVHPEKGIVTASDQEGHFVPATPIYLVPRGGYHGVPATAHRDDIPPETPPLLWIPHNVDQSGTSQLWSTGGALGFEGDALIHLSYGRPAAYRVYMDSTSAGPQGALVMMLEFPAPLLAGAFNPHDGNLYVTGFHIWGSRATEWITFGRLRYTGAPNPFPASVRPRYTAPMPFSRRQTATRFFEGSGGIL
jgi:hypothetical protein